ncbi:hypothetical protein SAMN05421837_103349 [Amycolatopsis pretoriensis]|uniref:Uncharacterized protein n=1 Tax=Amycolatopsis pretoriensis TaxID=218821 RepID=A0A1H5QMQ1_9PSEU|nr:hypothetical protein [Amycolatopsis pretoriensis]SEF26477.1 hypothetical protein SAMN05421837_103349 [Amycolatopsis pretoriensis]
MSAVFVVDPRGKRDLGFLDWNPSRGMLLRVLGFLADEVEDPALAADLREFVAGGYAFISLSSYTAEQGAEVMKVIREKLPAAVEEWLPGHEGARQHIAELVELVEEAEAAPDAG